MIIHNLTEFLNPFYVYDSCFKYRCPTKNIQQLEHFEFDVMKIDNFLIMLKGIYNFMYDKNVYIFSIMEQMNLSLNDYYYDLLKEQVISMRGGVNPLTIKYTKEWFENKLFSLDMSVGNLLKIDQTYFFIYKDDVKGILVKKIS